MTARWELLRARSALFPLLRLPYIGDPAEAEGQFAALAAAGVEPHVIEHARTEWARLNNVQDGAA